MKGKKLLSTAILLAVASVGFVVSASAEEKPSYALEGVTVTEAKSYDDTVIRTGGNVDVVTSKDIEEHHYSSVIDAIKRLPGVDVQESGTKAIEYGYGNYHDTISINGDKRVIILLDGKRLGNDAGSSVGDSFGKAQLFSMIGIQNVERIEVVKGAAAMAYGADCTGGVINIITKKGDRANTTLDVAYGSNSKQKYVVSNAGKMDRLSWIVSYNKDRRGDMMYVDREYDQERSYKNSAYNEDNTFVKLDYDLDKNSYLEVTHQYKHLKAGYPIEAPDYSAEGDVMNAIANSSNMTFKGTDGDVSESDWYRYHRWWYVFGDGSYTTNIVNNIDLKYNFKDKDGIDSYVRVFKNNSKFSMDRMRPNGNWSKVKDTSVKNYGVMEREQFSWAEEENKGINLRYGKKVDEKNTIYTGVDYAKSSVDTRAYDYMLGDFYAQDSNKNYTVLKAKGTIQNSAWSSIERDSMAVFVQDKISLDKLTVTPGLRYNFTGKGKVNTSSYKKGEIETDSFSAVTMGLYTNYEFDNNNSVYASWSQIYNAPYPGSMYKISSGEVLFNNLDAEKGNAYTIGYKGQLGKSSYGINYTLTKFDNTFGSYKYIDSSGDEVSRTTNIANDIQSIGLHYGYKFDKTWSVIASYSHAKDDLKLNAKSAVTNTDQLRNALHYTNKYTASLNYDKDKFSSGLDMTYYTGMDTDYFSKSSFMVLDWHLNYKINDKTTAYLLCNNLTNIAYETKSTSTEGIGCMPMQGRNFLVGVNYSF